MCFAFICHDRYLGFGNYNDGSKRDEGVGAAVICVEVPEPSFTYLGYNLLL